MVRKVEVKAWLDPKELNALDDLVRARGDVRGKRETRSTFIRDCVRDGMARQRQALGLEPVASAAAGGAL